MPPVSATRRRQPRQARAKATVAKILGAARRLLKAEGPAALNTNRLAAEAGVGVGSIYEYFPNKEAIAAELLEVVSAEEVASLEAELAAMAGAPLATVVERMIDHTFQLYRDNAALFDAVAAVAPLPDGTVGSRPGERALIERVGRRLAAEGVAAGAAAERMATTLFHTVEAVAHRLARRGEPDAVLRTELVAMIQSYLGVAPGAAEGNGS